MKFSEAVSTCLRNKYATFHGRASRSEFWFFGLFYLICTLVALGIDGALGTNGIITGLVELALILPSLSVMVRRLHDTGRSGWWYWITLVPAVGPILLLVWFCSKGLATDNNFGADPLSGASSFVPA